MNKHLIVKNQFLISILLISNLCNCSKKDSSDSGPAQTSKFPNDSSSFYDSLTNVKSFSVQVAAFKIKENANRIKLHLRKSNFPAYIDSTSNTSNELLHRIRLGPFYTMEAVDSILSDIKKIGYSEAFLLINSEEDSKDTLNTNIILSDTSEINKRQLTFNEKCSHPKWSPTGREIAFYKNTNGENGVYAIGTGGGYVSIIIEGSESREITPKFSWSPSGDKIAFVAREINENWNLVENLYQINIDGSGLKILLSQNNFSFEITDIKWSPDGQKIAFNAKYGDAETQADLIQRVLVISINRLTNSLKNEIGNADSKYITDPTHLEKTNWLIGWRTNNEFLFLSTYDKLHYYQDTAFEVWKYDFDSRLTTKILGGPAVKTFQTIELLPDENKIVYEYGAKLLFLDLQSAEETIIFATQMAENRPGLVFLHRSNLIFFLHEDEIWVSDFNGNITKSGVHFESQYFTLSPDGSQLCFEENGDLFKFKFSNINKKARY